MTADDSRRERLAILGAVEAALADPLRFLRILLGSTDDDDAVARLTAAYGVDDVQAQALLDLQVRRMVPPHRELLAEELRVLRADWGPEVEAQVRFSGRRSAAVSIDGAEHSFRAGGVDTVLQRISTFLIDDVAVPRLRPVVATVTGLPDGPVRMTCTPARSGRFEYHDGPGDRRSDG